MIRAIFWKEWREHRWKYAAYWLVLNAPILAAALSVALSAGARAPFADLSGATALKYLSVALAAEAGGLVSVFLFVTGFLAVATFRPEIEDGSLFYVFEQPVTRGRYIAWKLLNGGAHTALAVSFAALFAPAAAYGMMLLSGKVTVAGSEPAFAAVMAAAARGAVWCVLLSLAVFTASALIASLIPRWWLATAVTVLMIAAGSAAGGEFFDFIGPAFEALPQGEMHVGFGSSEWLKMTAPLPVEAFAPWRALPLAAAVLLTAAFSAAMGLIYARKELK